MKLISPWIRRLACFLLLIGAALLPQAQAASEFVTTGSMIDGRADHTATLLADGKVLVAGGYTYDGDDYGRFHLLNIGYTDSDDGDYHRLSSAELYDPVTGLWSATGSMASVRHNHTATLLANGKVLVTGGYNNTDGSLSSAELYDPTTRLWSTTGSMVSVRHNHTATLLTNGKVLVARDTSAELYDPATGLWSATDSMTSNRQNHTATLLANGKVLVAGGYEGDDELNGYLSSAELYDPATGHWSATGSMASVRHNHTATLLANGKVLVAGGYKYWEEGLSITSAELYDPATGQWSATGGMPILRFDHTATLLADGKVLVAGGGTWDYDGDYDEYFYDNLSSAELYDPVTGLWGAIGSMAGDRAGHTATVLANGKVLVAGLTLNYNRLSSADLYQGSLIWDDYIYSVLNGAVTITAYRGAGGAVTIPVTLDGLPVTSIDNAAFYGKISLTHLTIPNGIISIGNNAFDGCTGLTSVTISDSVTSIGNQAFSGCSGLTSLVLPERFLTDIEYIGLTGQLAATTLIQGIANNLSGNSAFIADFTNAALAGLATKSDLTSAVAPLASKTDLASYATKTELSTSLAPLASKEQLASAVNDATAPLASKTELATAVAPLASKLDALALNEEFIAALANNPAFLTALAKHIVEGPNQFGITIKQQQSLKFSPIAVQTYIAKKKLKLAATSSVKLKPITYVSSDPAVATVAGNIITLMGIGSATITASQAGNLDYNPATAVQVLTVK